MQETEITVEIFNTKQEAFDILTSAGYKNTQNYVLQDEYFSSLPLATLKKSSYEKIISSGVLVRKCVKNDSVKQTLVYKDKTVDKDGVVLFEEKTAVDISDYDTAVTVFKKACFTNWCSCINHSSVWEKDFSFVLQDIDGAGLFLEIEEDEALTGLSAKEKTEILIDRALSLGLKTGNDFSCKKNYRLFLNKS